MSEHKIFDGLCKHGFGAFTANAAQKTKTGICEPVGYILLLRIWPRSQKQEFFASL
jgi:hypothetical protein